MAKTIIYCFDTTPTNLSEKHNVDKENTFESINVETDFNENTTINKENTFDIYDTEHGTNELDFNHDLFIQYVNPQIIQVDENTRELKNGDLDIILKRVEGGSFAADSWNLNDVGGGIFPTKSSQKIIETEFYMGETMITQQMWMNVMQGNNNGIMIKPVEDPDFAATQTQSANYTYTANKPVYNISWYEAIVFCNRLSKIFGKEPLYSINGEKDPDLWGQVPNYNDTNWNNVDFDFNADGFGLPSMCQWFYAAYGGKLGAYCEVPNIGTSIIESTFDSRHTNDLAYYNYSAREPDNYRYNLVYPGRNSIISRASSTNQTVVNNVKTFGYNVLGLYDMLPDINMFCFDIKRPTIYSYVDEMDRGWYPISELGRMVIDDSAYTNNQQSITVGETTDTIPLPNPLQIPEEYTMLNGWPINYMPYKADYVDPNFQNMVDCTNSINNYRGIIPAYMTRSTYYEPFTNGMPTMSRTWDWTSWATGYFYGSDTIFNRFDSKNTFIDFMLNNNGINYCCNSIESAEDSKYTTNDFHSNSHFNQWNSLSNTIRNEISRTDMYNKLWTPNYAGIQQNETELQYMNSMKTGNYDDVQNKNGLRIIQYIPNSVNEFEVFEFLQQTGSNHFLQRNTINSLIIIKLGKEIILMSKVDTGDFTTNFLNNY